MSNGSPFATVGLCQTLGKYATVVGFGLGAVVGGIMGYMISKQNPGNWMIPYIIGGAILVGAIGALSMYLTCKGVSHGIPIKMK